MLCGELRTQPPKLQASLSYMFFFIRNPTQTPVNPSATRTQRSRGKTKIKKTNKQYLWLCLVVLLSLKRPSVIPTGLDNRSMALGTPCLDLPFLAPLFTILFIMVLSFLLYMPLYTCKHCTHASMDGVHGLLVLSEQRNKAQKSWSCQSEELWPLCSKEELLQRSYRNCFVGNVYISRGPMDVLANLAQIGSLLRKPLSP